MTENDDKQGTKFILSLVKTVPSIVIEDKLLEQEKLAQQEHRFEDLLLLGIGHVIKRSADLAIDNWIANL